MLPFFKAVNIICAFLERFCQLKIITSIMEIIYFPAFFRDWKQKKTRLIYQQQSKVRCWWEFKFWNLIFHCLTKEFQNNREIYSCCWKPMFTSENLLFQFGILMLIIIEKKNKLFLDRHFQRSEKNSRKWVTWKKRSLIFGG